MNVTSLSNIFIFHCSLSFFTFQELFYNRDRRFMNHRRSIVRRIGRELSRYQIKLFAKRSIVREIGSRLPLKPCKRPYFEVNCSKTDKLSLLNAPVDYQTVESPSTFHCSIVDKRNLGRKQSTYR